MSDPRYSIIPAGAVTDPRLEGRDLQVLCFLGKHTDKLGWCFLSQGTIAKEIRCSRSTVQRSITRLAAADYVYTKVFEVSSLRPHACLAYRTIMDRDDPQVGPSELEVEDQKQDTEVPTGAQGCPQVHRGAHVCMGTERPSKILDADDARARETTPLVKPEAWKLATEIAVIAGYPDPQSWPPGWCGAPMRVQAMLDHGWQPEIMLASVRAVMARKTGDPPSSINYFEKPFASAHVQQSKPFPTASDQTRESRHGVQTPQQRARDKFRDAVERVAEFGRSGEGAVRSDDGCAPVQILLPARR